MYPLGRNESRQSQKKARSLKCRVYKEEELYKLCSKDKSTDQLCSFCTPDLDLLCVPSGKNLFFSHDGAHMVNNFAGCGPRS